MGTLVSIIFTNVGPAGPSSIIAENITMSTVSLVFNYEKETKNSVRYQEQPEAGKAPIVGSLYVQKWFAGDSKVLTLTLEKND